MPSLVWDLHVHPAPSLRPRWGDGAAIRAAAARVGARGFVWKAHEGHTDRLCAELPPGPPHALASASLNPWMSPESVIDAVEAGAAWIWGPTCTPDGEIGWDLPLPEWWTELRLGLSTFAKPFVLATGHLGSGGRRAFAEAASELRDARCSITHSLYVTLEEVRLLAATGAAFELDAYTFVFLPKGPLLGPPKLWIEAFAERESIVYFTSDGGQAHSGDPFAFAERVLQKLEPMLGLECVKQIAQTGPEAMAAPFLQALKEAAT